MTPEVGVEPPAAAAAGRPEHLAQPAVAVAGLHKSFGSHQVLSGVDLQLPEGSITAILAPSGSGKTTLLRLIAGFDMPDRGTITIAGALVAGPGRNLGPAVRHIGYVPQEGALFPHLDIAANIGFGLRRGARRERVAEMLELIGLPHLGGRFPHQLSGGEQQRVALARALAPSPALMLLDEPFSSLDASLRISVRLDLTRILALAGTTTIIVTHDQDEALSMADQIAVLRDGIVVQAGSPRHVYAHPVDVTLARFLGAANLLDGKVSGGRALTALGLLELDGDAGSLADGTAVDVLIRPEQIELVGPGKAAPLAGIVQHCDFHGHDAVLTVAAGEGAAGWAVVDGAAGTRVAAPGAAPLDEPLTVRTEGAGAAAPGTPVRLRASGPVVAWPAT